jgi:hypothetical protein
LAFTSSLHQLSIFDGIRAAAARTPHRIAIVEGGESLSYAQLMAVAGCAQTSPILRWLGSMRVQAPADETQVAATMHDGESTVELSHRELLLLAFDRIVIHAAFDRDGVLAMPLPLSLASAWVAATISLWLGGTLHLLQPGSLDALAHGMAHGRFNTCWLGAAELEALGRRRDALPSPAETFLLAVCDPSPSAQVRERLVAWLGPARVAE